MVEENQKWPHKPLGSLAIIQSGGTPNRKTSKFWIGGTIPWVTTTEVSYSIINNTKEKITEAGLVNSSAKIFPKNTILMALYGQGKTRGQVGILGIEAATNQACAAIQPKGTVDNGFLYEFLKGSYNHIRRLSNSGGQDNLSSTLISEIQVPLPPLPEQSKIAEILRTWDEGLAALTALRNAKADALTALLQNLIGINGGADRNWEMKPLHELATRVRRKNDGGDHPVMTISAKSGFLLQSDRYSRNMAGRSVENYTIIHEGEFAYNKGNSKTAPQGCIFVLDRPTALVPNVYICFALQEGLNREFYGHLFSAGALNHQLSRVINSGVRNDGLLNLNAGDFFDCKLPLPPIEEQQAIASALTTAKQELTLIDRQIDALSRQKRGLMQKLLTGEWRVRP